MGFPLFKKRMCKFRNYSKERALDKCDLGYYNYQDVGIALDESARHGQLNDTKRSILVEMGYTEDMAFDFCRDRNLLSPHYKHAKRDGCALCPHAKKEERTKWFNDYPEAIPLVIELQNLVKTEIPDQTPLRNHQWFIDTDQVTFFDKEVKE